MLYKCYYNSPIGKLTLFSNGTSLIGLQLENPKYDLKLNEEPIVNKELKIFKEVSNWLDKYFKGENPNPHILKLEPNGSKFQKEVWKILRTIPYGETTTYGKIAKQIGSKNNTKMSAQAVGGAISRNKIAIIIPCHRVIGQNNRLTGYAGGLNIKVKLLELEGTKVIKL